MERKKKQTYCLVCRDCTKSINPEIVRNKQNRLMIESNCAIYVLCNTRQNKMKDALWNAFN